MNVPRSQVEKGEDEVLLGAWYGSGVGDLDFVRA